MTIYTVTGLGYGDEGKGTTVDFLARQDRSLVVRHNGGPQAGHNVVLTGGRHHEFSQWGSGHFAGAHTFLSKHMLVNPMDMIMESLDLHRPEDSNPWKMMHIDQEARIITPYHIALNRLKSYAKGESCGRGVGEAMRQDIDRPDLTIRVKDTVFTNLASSSLEHKLDDLRHYLRLQHLEFDDGTDTPEASLLADRHRSKEMATDYWDWRAMGWSIVTNGNVYLGLTLGSNRYANIIFEGAQGVLLDEWNGFHPYTTWSTTTDANALSLLKESGWSGPVERLGVIRAYATRHGAGPFVSEDDRVSYAEPHNTTGTYQGEFRRGHLDLVALRYAKAVMYADDPIKLVVTHLDRGDIWGVVDDYTTRQFHNIRDIALNPEPHDLKRQERLTQQLMNTKPTYRAVHNTSSVLALLENIAPIALQSYGPTAADKTWVNNPEWSKA